MPRPPDHLYDLAYHLLCADFIWTCSDVTKLKSFLCALWLIIRPWFDLGIVLSSHTQLGAHSIPTLIVPLRLDCSSHCIVTLSECTTKQYHPHYVWGNGTLLFSSLKVMYSVHIIITAFCMSISLSICDMLIARDLDMFCSIKCPPFVNILYTLHSLDLWRLFVCIQHKPTVVETTSSVVFSLYLLDQWVHFTDLSFYWFHFNFPEFKICFGGWPSLRQCNFHWYIFERQTLDEANCFAAINNLTRDEPDQWHLGGLYGVMLCRQQTRQLMGLHDSTE